MHTLVVCNFKNEVLLFSHLRFLLFCDTILLTKFNKNGLAHRTISLLHDKLIVGVGYCLLIV